jgi:hypothetical protein
MAMPRSGSEIGVGSDTKEEGLDDRGVSAGVRAGGVPLRRRMVLALVRSVRFAYEARLSCKA